MNPSTEPGASYSDIGSTTVNFVRSWIFHKNYSSSKNALETFEDEFKVSLLILTSFLGQLDIVSSILSTSYVDINQGYESVHNATALHVAVVRNHVDIVEMLLTAGADVNSKTYPFPPLIIAITYNNNIKIANTLIEAGANIDEKDGRHDLTALLYATLIIKPKLVDILIKSGADVNVTGKSDMSPLHTVMWSKTASKIIEEDRNQVISLLIDAKADIDAGDMYDNTPLHYATKNALAGSVKILLVAGANPDKLNKHGVTPLGYSIIFRYD